MIKWFLRRLLTCILVSKHNNNCDRSEATKNSKYNGDDDCRVDIVIAFRDYCNRSLMYSKQINLRAGKFCHLKKRFIHKIRLVAKITLCLSSESFLTVAGGTRKRGSSRLPSSTNCLVLGFLRFEFVACHSSSSTIRSFGTSEHDISSLWESNGYDFF